MTCVIVPPLDSAPWPSLGPQVCAWVESNLVYGPGDLRGKPVKLDDEKRGLIYRAYEVYPPSHPKAGRRRFKRVAVSLRKGSAKTEWAAMLAAAELHPDAPVRCDGFDATGCPVGVGVVDPYIPLVAYTEEQSDELAYAALKAILENSPVADDFDIGLERIIRKGGDGRAVSLAAAPDARDGARTTFQVVDESHRWTLERLRLAHRTMLANIPKRRGADGWCLEVTTAFTPGEDSIAERTWHYAQEVLKGDLADPKLFFFHRQASDRQLVTASGAMDPEAVRASVLEASGPVAAWSDIDAIVDQFLASDADLPYLERVWLNRLVQASAKAFDASRWQHLAMPGHVIPDGAKVTLGFDGGRYHDATALVATEASTGFQATLGVWEQPYGQLGVGWEVPELEVEAAVAAAMERWDVWRLYADPPYWESTVAKWAGEYGEKRVIAWPTNRYRRMADVIRAFSHAMRDGEVKHDGNTALARHIANAHRQPLLIRDDKGEPMWVIRKERPDSPNKIDAAMAAALAWEARRDALTAGAGQADDEWDGKVRWVG